MKLRTSWTFDNPCSRYGDCLGCNVSNVFEMYTSLRNFCALSYANFWNRRTKKKCDSWEWLDPSMCHREKKIISVLLKRINQCEDEIQNINCKLRVKATEHGVNVYCSNYSKDKNILVLLVLLLVGLVTKVCMYYYMKSNVMVKTNAFMVPCK